MVKFSAKYLPTTLFSLKDSNSTNSGAKSLFLPSPYSIKMAILNQAITLGDEFDKLNENGSQQFNFIKNAKISFHLPQGSSFCVNNTFVKILKIKEDKSSKKDKEAGKVFEPGFQETISFREYIHITKPIEIIFEVFDELAVSYFKKILHKINYFGKRGCFFQFLEYSDNPKEPNVVPFVAKYGFSGLLQKYDDFDENVSFEMVNNFSGKSTRRKELIWILPLKVKRTSKSYSHFYVN